MSRSYKKTPRTGDKKSKYLKRCANKRLRKKDFDTDFQHNSYKKFFESYDICDFEEVGTSFEDYWDSVLHHWYAWRHLYEPFPDKEEIRKDWYKYFKRK